MKETVTRDTTLRWLKVLRTEGYIVTLNTGSLWLGLLAAAIVGLLMGLLMSFVSVTLKGTTIPHMVIGRCGASKVKMIPASDGTGVIAGKKLRPLLELAGIHNVLTKAYGSTSPKNLLKAGLDALRQLRTAETISQLRGVTIE